MNFKYMQQSKVIVHDHVHMASTYMVIKLCSTVTNHYLEILLYSNVVHYRIFYCILNLFLCETQVKFFFF